VLMGLGELSMDPRRAESPPAQKEISRLLGLSLLVKGNFTPATGALWSISAPMTRTHIKKTVDDLNGTLDYLMESVKSAAPELIVG